MRWIYFLISKKNNFGLLIEPVLKLHYKIINKGYDDLCLKIRPY